MYLCRFIGIIVYYSAFYRINSKGGFTIFIVPGAFLYSPIVTEYKAVFINWQPIGLPGAKQAA